jgi:hypothetical protein
VLREEGSIYILRFGDRVLGLVGFLGLLWVKVRACLIR